MYFTESGSGISDCDPEFPRANNLQLLQALHTMKIEQHVATHQQVLSNLQLATNGPD